jgi:hypothetical protein
MDKRFGTWIVKNLCRVGSLTTVGREITKYKIDLMRIHKITWDMVGTKPTGNYIFPVKIGIRIMNNELGTVFSMRKRTI